MQFSRWYLIPESGYGHGAIKRYPLQGKKTWQRYPRHNYKGLDKQETEALLRRLNAAFEAKEIAERARYDFHHAFINQQSIKQFEEYLSSQAEDLGHISTCMNWLHEYTFAFFISKHQLPDPNDWFRKEVEWGQWLLTKDLKVGTIKKIVGNANRFTGFLSDRVYRDMSTPRTLEPIGKAKLKNKAIKEKDTREKYIKPETMKKIISWFKNNEPDLLPNVLLCKNLGLRIGESMGLRRTSFLKDSVYVERQGDKFTKGKLSFRPVKTLDKRKVPYWYITAKEAWLLAQQCKPMSPCTLMDKVNAGLSRFDHLSHDFRRTFITDSLRKYHWKDVQKAVGHKDPRTTMGYDQDDRELSDELADLD